MMRSLFALIPLFFQHGSCANAAYLERRPALGIYQDESTNFPLNETWYMLYRNYESDPALGVTAKCVRFSQTGEGSYSENLLLLEYDGSSVNINSTLWSSPGYSAKNILLNQPLKGNSTIEMITAYVDPTECDVLRMPYISDSACALLVPESRVSNASSCCEFIFDLLCGTTPKYSIYDSSCLTQN